MSIGDLNKQVDTRQKDLYKFYNEILGTDATNAEEVLSIILKRLFTGEIDGEFEEVFKESNEDTELQNIMKVINQDTILSSNPVQEFLVEYEIRYRTPNFNTMNYHRTQVCPSRGLYNKFIGDLEGLSSSNCQVRILTVLTVART